MSFVQAETCSKYEKVTNWTKINLCGIRMNKCHLFSKKHNGMAGSD